MIYRRLDIICIVGWCLNTDLLSPIAARRHSNTGVRFLGLTSRMSSIDFTIDATRCLCLLKFNLRQFGHQYPCRFVQPHYQLFYRLYISQFRCIFFIGPSVRQEKYVIMTSRVSLSCFAYLPICNNENKLVNRTVSVRRQGAYRLLIVASHLGLSTSSIFCNLRLIYFGLNIG